MLSVPQTSIWATFGQQVMFWGISVLLFAPAQTFIASSFATPWVRLNLISLSFQREGEEQMLLLFATKRMWSRNGWMLSKQLTLKRNLSAPPSSLPFCRFLSTPFAKLSDWRGWGGGKHWLHASLLCLLSGSGRVRVQTAAQTLPHFWSNITRTSGVPFVRFETWRENSFNLQLHLSLWASELSLVRNSELPVNHDKLFGLHRSCHCCHLSTAR